MLGYTVTVNEDADINGKTFVHWNEANGYFVSLIVTAEQFKVKRLSIVCEYIELAHWVRPQYHRRQSN